MSPDNTDQPTNDDVRLPQDPLQPADDLFNPLHDEERLPEDNTSPAAPPDDTVNYLSPEHPDTDTGLDPHEAYDAGISSAAEPPADSGDPASH